MTTSVTLAPLQQAQQQPDQDEVVCRLDCLEQPRFFCGQLLTEHDLNDLLKWVQGKVRLNRFRDGWGVVCGLDVRIDPKNAAQVVVGPGYALNGCGDDIIVCEDALFSLDEVCIQEKDPCEQPDQGQSTGARIRTVDLFIHYKEEKSHLQAVIGRDPCHKVAECEYGRTLEHHVLKWSPVRAETDPFALVADVWKGDYLASMNILCDFKKKFGSLTGTKISFKQAQNMAVELLQDIDSRPLRQFGMVIDELCQIRDRSEATKNEEADIKRLLFMIAQDRANVFLNCACFAGGSGVRIARVWVKTRDEKGRRTCKIQFIDTQPPYRRPLMRDCWPAPLGQINVAQVYWHRPEEAQAILSGLGLDATGTTEYTPGDYVTVMEQVVCGTDARLDENFFAAPGSEITLQVVDVDGYEQRVVGFSISGSAV